MLERFVTETMSHYSSPSLQKNMHMQYHTADKKSRQKNPIDLKWRNVHEFESQLSLSHTLTLTHTHTHTCWFLWFMGTLHRRNGFNTEQTVCAIALHLP